MRRMKNKTKKLIKFVALALVAIGLFAMVAHVSSGFDNLNPKDWKLRTVNEENLYQQMAFLGKDGVYEDGADGLTVKIDDETNVLRVSGTSEEDKTIALGTVTLKANTSYIFDSDLSNGTNKTVYMFLSTSNGQVIAKSYNGPVVIAAENLPSDTTVTLNIFVAKDHSINKTLKPVICVGNDVDNIIGFYG